MEEKKRKEKERKEKKRKRERERRQTELIGKSHLYRGVTPQYKYDPIFVQNTR
jgi:hypothetical protein